MPFKGPRREHVPSVISIALEHQWVDSGSFVSHSLRLPVVLKAKARYSFELVVPGFFKVWIWIRKEASILAKARRTCWHEDHTDTLSEPYDALLLNKLYLAANVFGKTDFFPMQPSTHSMQTLLANCFPTHTKRHKINDHD